MPGNCYYRAVIFAYLERCLTLCLEERLLDLQEKLGELGDDPWPPEMVQEVSCDTCGWVFPWSSQIFHRSFHVLRAQQPLFELLHLVAEAHEVELCQDRLSSWLLLRQQGSLTVVQQLALEFNRSDVDYAFVYCHLARSSG